jgi:hypothetical protein
MCNRPGLRSIKTASPWCAVLALFCGLTAGSEAASAVECGEVLTQDTVLEADLSCPGDGLVVGADGIVIDLGGHLLRGSGIWSIPSTAGIRNEGYDDVEIRNGRIERFEHGINLVDVAGNRIEALSVYGDNGSSEGIALVA